MLRTCTCGGLWPVSVLLRGDSGLGGEYEAEANHERLGGDPAGTSMGWEEVEGGSLVMSIASGAGVT